MSARAPRNDGGTPIFWAVVDDHARGLLAGGRHHWLDAPTTPLPAPLPTTRGAPVTAPQDEPVADTAGEQDHEDPWAFAGEDADAPADLGRTDDTPDGPRDYAQLAADAQTGGGL